MNEKPESIKFDVSFSKDFNKIKNSGFVIGRAKIAYVGENRNLSDISKEAFEKAMDSLALVPLVGNWIPEKENFGGHDVSYEEVGNTIKEVNKTIAMGVVPESHNAEWVDVEDKNGNIKKYLECDVVLWEERYKEPVQKIISGGANQSMEIIPTDCDWNEDTGYFKINDFYYSALCLLGRDEENPENNIEPCFEQSEVVISQFNLDKDKFKSEFNLMVQELKQSLYEGGEDMTDVKEDVVEEKVEVVGEVVTDDLAEISDAEVKEEETVEETEKTEEVVEPEEDYKLKYNELLSDYDNLKSENSTLQENYKALESEIVELREFKKVKEKEEFDAKQEQLKQEKIDHINTEYANISDDVKELFISKVDEYETVEDIDADMCVYIVKNKVSFSKAKDNSLSNVKIGVEGIAKEIKTNPYEGLF